MFKSLYTLSEKYSGRKLVIYGVNRTSVNLFTNLAVNHDVDIDAFLDVADRFTGESFVNREIINISQLKNLDDVILIMPEAYKKIDIRRYLGNEIDVFYKDEILDLNPELYREKIYIYGIGKKEEAIYEVLQKKGVQITGMCTKTPCRIEKWCGKAVFSMEDIGQKGRSVIILPFDIEQMRTDIPELLWNDCMEKYIFHYMSENVIANMNFFQIINATLHEDNKVWLYGRADEYTQYLKKVLQRYYIGIDRECYEEEIYDLGYEDIAGISVIVTEKDEGKTECVCDTLDSMGFGLEKWDYTATNWCTCKANWTAAVTKKDILLYRGVSVNEQYPGYDVYGDEKLAKMKIMVLGGSTSTSSVYRAVSWVECLYRKMSESGYHPVIYNGAMCSYGVVDEYIKMVRDIEPLKPDFVISFSGVNNTSVKKSGNQFNTCAGEFMLHGLQDAISGVRCNETLYDFWCRVSRLIRITAECYGAKVYNFLQPMNSTDLSYDLIQTGMFELTEHKEHIQECKARASLETDRFYMDLSTMLDGKKGMYIDMCHYSTQAAGLIAERVFETMEHDFDEFENR